jgi:hypothetical protein
MTVTCYGDRMVYAHEFYDENENPVAAYIGLTANEDRRKEEHLTGIGFTGKEQLSKVTKFLKENPSLHHSYKKLSDYVDCENAQKLESDYVNEYRNNGWQILNVAKTGGLGGYKKNTKEFLKKKVNIWIKNKTDNGQTPYITLFKKEEPKLYSTIIINKAGDYCFDNLITKEQEILDIAKKCVSYQEFRNKYENTYFLKAKRYGILDDVKKLFV